MTLLLSEGQQAQLRQVVQTHGDYVNLWRRYSEQEWQRSLRQAADLGILKYTKVDEASQEGGAWRFYADPKEVERFASAWKSIESDGAIALEADEQRPDWQNAPAARICLKWTTGGGSVVVRNSKHKLS